MSKKILLICAIFALSLVSVPVASAATQSQTDVWQAKWEKIAHNRLDTLNKARACYNLPKVGLDKYEKHSDGIVWKAVAVDLRKRFNKVHSRMVNPRNPSGAERWLPLARHVGWPRDQEATLVKVIWRESNGIPTVGGTFRGLMQVWVEHSPLNLYNPHVNLAVSLQLWHREGWRPWSQTAY
jgi:hypothetical protein